MAGFTDYMEEKILRHVFGNAVYTAPATVYVGLHLGDPGEAAGAGQEVTAGGYARVAFGTMTFAKLADGRWNVNNTALVQFPGATADWGMVSHAALYESLTGGNRMASGPLTTAASGYATASPRDVKSGDIVRFPAGQLGLALD